MTKLTSLRNATVRLLLVAAIAMAALAPAVGLDLPLPYAAGASSARATEGFELGPAPIVTDPAVLAPTIARDPQLGTRAINTQNRQDVVNQYNSVYTPALLAAANWTGSITGCVAGTTAAAYETATLQTINYFRAMAGLPDNVTFDATFSSKDRDAALMMIAQGALSHFPGTSFACYTAGGAEAAGNSNIAIGIHGPTSVRGYIEDSDGSAPVGTNAEVGHRRWILYPPQAVMGTGSTTGLNGFFSGSNALWILGPMGPRPTIPEFVTWPPRGFVPYPITFGRWSFSYPQADFSNATVTMTRGGTSIALTQLAVVPAFGTNQFIGDNTLVWEPQGITTSAGMTDTTYTVILSNVRVGGVARSFTYDVTIIDPASTAPVPTSTVPPPTSTATPPPTGGITGGRAFSISPSTGGTAMSWLPGTTQTGYAVVLFLPTGVTVPPTLPSSATSYFDARTFSGTTCYLLVPTGPGGALGRSDLLCWLLNSRTPTGAAQNFTMRLDQSNVATFTWTGPLGGGQTGYQLVPLGNTPIDLPVTATTTTHTLTGPTCYALITLQGVTPSGLTDVVCGFPGIASL